MAVEFDDFVTGILEGDEVNAKFNALKANANISIKFVGDGTWNNSTLFDKNTIVEHAGKWWIAKQDNINSLPVEGLDWKAFVSVGASVSDGSITFAKFAPDVIAKFDERPTTGDVEALISDALAEFDSAQYEAGENVSFTANPDTGKTKINAVGELSATLTANSVSVVTTMLDSGDSEVFSVELGKCAKLVRIETDAPAWVRLYPSNAAKIADESRQQTEYYEGDLLIFDYLSRDGDLDTLLEAVDAFSLESPRTDSYPLVIQNAGVLARTINVTLTFITLEI